MSKDIMGYGVSCSLIDALGVSMTVIGTAQTFFFMASLVGKHREP